MGVPVSAILHALEKASQARIKRRSRIPLALKHAKRHLSKTVDKPCDSMKPSQNRTEAQPLAKMALKLTNEHGDPDLDELKSALLALNDGEHDVIVRKALEQIRVFFQKKWLDLSEHERNQSLQRARDDLAGLMANLSEVAAEQLAENIARDRLRAEYPLLSADTLWDTLRLNPLGTE